MTRVRADYRHGAPIALKYVKRGTCLLWRFLIESSIQCGIYTFIGYHLLVRHAVVLTLAPFALMGVVRWFGTNHVPVSLKHNI